MLKLIKHNVKFIKKMKLLYTANFVLWLFIIVSPIVESIIISRLILSFNSVSNAIILISLFACFSFIKVYFIYYGGIVDTRVRYRVINFIHLKIVNKMLKSKNDQPSKIIDILENDSSVISEFNSYIIDFICNVLFYIIAIIMLLRISFIITLMIIVFAILTNIIHILFNKYVGKINKYKRDASIDVTTYLEKSLKNKSSIMSLNSNVALEEFKLRIDKYNASLKKEQFIVTFFNQIGYYSVYVQIATILFISLYINLSASSIIGVTTLLLLGLTSIDMFLEMRSLTIMTKNSYKNIEQIDGEELIKNKMICKKDSIFFNGTIAENICFWDIEKSKLEEILTFVNMDKELEGRNIYSEMLDENGSGLSLGQKYRLFLARALYNADDTIILEDIFSHLDEKNRVDILKKLDDQSFVKVEYI